MQNRDSLTNFRLNIIVIIIEFMNFKVLKLNLKISWLKFTGKLDTISNSDNFSPATIDSPCILIILPIDQELISKAMKCISRIMDIYNKKNAKFTVIVNNNIQDKVNLYNMKKLAFSISKNGSVNNSKKIMDQIYFDKFDLIIDLNINFSFDISMMINELRSKYKVGFASDYSDYFYNIQLRTNKNNPSYNSLEYLLGKI